MTDTQPSDDAQDDPTVETVEFTNENGERKAKMNVLEFVHKLQSIERAANSLEALRGDVASINTGLREEDAIRLIYGRNGNWSLSDIRSMFDTLDTISGASDRKLIVRLLADLGNVKLDDSEEFYEEVERLRERYGDLVEEEQ